MAHTKLWGSLHLGQQMAGGRLGDGTPLTGQQTLTSINPSNEGSLGDILLLDAAGYAKIITCAQAAAHQWRDIPAPVRGQVVKALATKISQNHEALAELISVEMGKTLIEARGEVQEMLDMADLAIGLSRSLAGQTLVSERVDHRLLETWHPLGVVGVITAFNFPMAVWAWNAMLACVCGNSVIWKPSSLTPFCALAVQQLCEAAIRECQAPPIFNLMIAEHSQSERLVADERVALVSFTGSTPVGRGVASVVSGRLGKVLLELGGNNAVIVDETANMDLVVPAVFFGAIGTAGQRCTTTRRVIIHESRYESLIQRLLAAYAQIKMGDPTHVDNHLGPLISQEAVDNYLVAVAELKRSSSLLTGGERVVGPGYFVTPCIAKVEPTIALWREEIFAPILLIATYTDFERAIAMHNDVPQGLSSALFTEQLRQAEWFLSARGSDCGLANINTGTSGAEIGGAFGGEKATGGGREAGSDAWKNYMRRQTTVINWSKALPLAQGLKF